MYTVSEIITACNDYDDALIAVNGEYSKNCKALTELHDRATEIVDWIFCNLTVDGRVFTLPSGEKIRHVQGTYFDKFELV